MRVLQVVHGIPPHQIAGTEIYTYNLAKKLSKRHEVHVFYPRRIRNTFIYKYSLKSFKKEDIVFHELHIPFNFLEALKYKLNFESSYKNSKIEYIFKELLSNLNPDIVHFQHLINLSVSLIDVAKSKEIPTIMTLHDYWFICPLVQLLNYNYEVCRGPNSDGKNCCICWNSRQVTSIADYLSKFLIPTSFSKRIFNVTVNIINNKEKFRKRFEYMLSKLLRVDRIIAPSKFLRNLFIYYGIPKEKIVYSDNGYNLDIFSGFNKKQKKDNGLVFGFVGGIARHKGVDVLIEAFNEINDKNVELRIYGNCNPKSEYFKRLKDKIRNPNIKFIGKFEDIRKPFSEMDILIFPSIWYENCPLVLKEAMVTKTPVIASNIGAIPEFVKDGVNGLLFEAGNSNDLYLKIKRVINNPEILEEFIKNIKNVKSIEKQSKELEKIYMEVIST